MYRGRVQQEVNPYRKKKIKIIVVVLLCVVLGLSITFIGLVQKKRTDVIEPNTNVCDLSQDEILETFKDYRFSDTQRIEDYFFYGENLSVFDQEYAIDDVHKLIGKTLILRNMCSEEEFHYLIDSDVNSQIPLEHLPDGFYEVFMNVDMVRRRVVMSESVKDSLNLVRRNEGIRRVEMLADKYLFDDKDHKQYLREDYLFLSVESSLEQSSDYDLVLDPALGVNESGFFNNYGRNALGMIEADELYTLALMIKEELEQEGLKVLVTRDNPEHIINAYGKDGRLDRAYQSKAKYLVELGFNTGDESGLKVTKSSFTNATFASTVANYLLDHTDLQVLGNKSVYSARRFNGLDGDINIRESGGKALAAATYSDLAKQSNSSFAYNNRKALEAISIEYLSFNNEADLEHYQVQKEEYAKQTAHALLEYFKLGVQNDISD